MTEKDQGSWGWEFITRNAETGLVIDCQRIRELEEEIRALKAAHEWQPISTAPRDGTPVDLWHINGFRMTEVWWDSEDGCWTSLMDDKDFSHWMSVPAPPGYHEVKEKIK